MSCLFFSISLSRSSSVSRPGIVVDNPLLVKMAWTSSKIVVVTQTPAISLQNFWLKFVTTFPFFIEFMEYLKKTEEGLELEDKQQQLLKTVVETNREVVKQTGVERNEQGHVKIAELRSEVKSATRAENANCQVGLYVR